MILWDFYQFQTSEAYFAFEYDHPSEPALKNVAALGEGMISAVQYDLDGDMESVDGWNRENDEEGELASRCVGLLQSPIHTNLSFGGVSIRGTIPTRHRGDEGLDDLLGIQGIWVFTNPRTLTEEEAERIGRG